MKKKLLSIFLCAAMVGTLFAGCGSQPAADNGGNDTPDTTVDAPADNTTGGLTYAFVPKSAGNPFNEKQAEGFEQAIKSLGGTPVVQYPEAATADAQITVIQSLISQGVASICVAANDANALQAVLEEAKAAGIQVCSCDSSVNAASRATHVNQAGVDEIGLALIDAVLDICGGEGQYAILSATSQATNQNAWIESMKKFMESDPKYANLELVEVAYGDDEPQKSTDQTQALLKNYPELKCICAPTTVGIAAAAKVLQDQKSAVKLTGLGLPSEMEAYIGDGTDFSCPYMFLWNPIDLGALGGYTSFALVNGDITGAEGDTFSCTLGNYTVVGADDGGTEIILGAPFKFEPSNIAEWAQIY